MVTVGTGAGARDVDPNIASQLQRYLTIRGGTAATDNLLNSGFRSSYDRVNTDVGDNLLQTRNIYNSRNTDATDDLAGTSVRTTYNPVQGTVNSIADLQNLLLTSPPPTP